jgi:isoleucyl-tRNA synthetase
MIFAGGNASRLRLEVEAQVVLQRLLLSLVIGYALLAPLVITDAFRAYRGADQQGAVQLQQSRQFRKQVVDAVEPTTSAAELAQVLRRFPQIRSSINP